MTANSILCGIDLGTSHCALSYKKDGEETSQTQECQQFLAPGQLTQHPLLPSCLYLPLDAEAEKESWTMPWETEQPSLFIPGLYAKRRSQEMGDRVITSAKSWLCHPYVERQDAILPWDSDVINKLSPVKASSLLLQHLRGNLLHHNSGALGKVVLTVPASFDESARRLTLIAAEEAGFRDVALLEEPQAAFYGWINANQAHWRDMIEPGDLIAICDVGGGTTDFSLIAVGESEGGDLQLERISVGDHLLLGGDNMDLALADVILADFAAKGVTLDKWQQQSLVHAAREAKEVLLGESEGGCLQSIPISIPSRGSKLFAQTLSTELTFDQVVQSILEGFFPRVSAVDMPQRQSQMGLMNFGLPYESDSAITRHLAKFIQQSWQRIQQDDSLRGRFPSAMPHKVLFNGGVLKSPVLRKRILDVLNSWNLQTSTSENLQTSTSELVNGNFDLAVSQGACYYAGLLASGEGIPIKAGTAFAYYVGIESNQMAVPGRKPQIRGICLVPQGTPEGSELTMKGRPFGLVTGEPVAFRFFRSKMRPQDQLGHMVDADTGELEETSPLSLTLPGNPGEVVPVTLRAQLDGVGMLQVYLSHLQNEQKWALEYNLRARPS